MDPKQDKYKEKHNRNIIVKLDEIKKILKAVRENLSHYMQGTNDTDVGRLFFRNNEGQR